MTPSCVSILLSSSLIHKFDVFSAVFFLLALTQFSESEVVNEQARVNEHLILFRHWRTITFRRLVHQEAFIHIRSLEKTTHRQSYIYAAELLCLDI